MVAEPLAVDEPHQPQAREAFDLRSPPRAEPKKDFFVSTLESVAAALTLAGESPGDRARSLAGLPDVGPACPRREPDPAEAVRPPEEAAPAAPAAPARRLSTEDRRGTYLFRGSTTFPSHEPFQRAAASGPDVVARLPGDDRAAAARALPLLPSPHAEPLGRRGSRVGHAFARAFVTLAQMGQAPPNPRAWLLRVASNSWIDRMRRLGREEPLIGDMDDARTATEPADTAAGTLLGQLSPQERAPRSCSRTSSISRSRRPPRRSRRPSAR